VTDPKSEGDEAAQPWWHGTAEGMPDIEALLGEEGMAAVGTVADEALRLFVVLRERFTTPPAGEAVGAQPGARPSAGTPWEDLLGQLAAGAVRTVNELAAGAQAVGAAAPHDTGEEQSTNNGGAQQAAPGEPVVQPGEAAACAYCPICQAIALFRSVPMTTWQRLASSVVEVADAARDVANTAAPQSAPIVVTPVAPADDSGSATVEDLLADLAAPESDPEATD
jgi:hypothetical protein